MRAPSAYQYGRSGKGARRELRQGARELAGLEPAHGRGPAFDPAHRRDVPDLAEQRQAIAERAPATAEVGQPLLVACESALGHPQAGPVALRDDLEPQDAPVRRLELHREHAARIELDDRAAEVQRGVVKAARGRPVGKRETPRAARVNVGNRAREEPASEVVFIGKRAPHAFGRSGDVHRLVHLDFHRPFDHP